MVKPKELLATQLFVLLLASVPLAVSLFPKVSKVPSLNALCQDKTIHLTKISEFLDLVEKIGDPSIKCPSHTEDVIMEMKHILTAHEDNVCSKHKAKVIEKFYLKHLDSSSDQKQKPYPVPKSLRKFFLAYSMQVVNYCKLNMISAFMHKGIELKGTGEFRELLEWTRAGSPVDQIIQVFTKPGEILTPTDLQAALTDDQKTVTTQLTVETEKSASMERIQAICSRRFRPIYGPLIEPVASLTRLGIDYSDKLLVLDLKDKCLVDGLNEWSRVVFFCEAMLAVKVQQPEQDTASDIEQGDPNSDLELLSYEPEKVKLVDGIMNSYDSKIETLVKNFDTSKNYLQRLRERFLLNGWNLLKVYFKYGQYREIFHKTSWNSKKLGEVQKDDLLKLLTSGNKKETDVSKVLSHLAAIGKKVNTAIALPLAFVNLLYLRVVYGVLEKIFPRPAPKTAEVALSKDFDRITRF